MSAPPLPAAFFALQLAFARRVVVVTGIPINEALLHYTTCYSATGLIPYNLTVAPNAPQWQAFLAGFAVADDPAAYAHGIYLAHYKPDLEHTVCFSYRYEDETRAVRMQFANNDPLGSLSRGRVDARRAELSALMERAREEHPDAARVKGQSWLYHIEAYRRLFPPTFVTAPVPVPGEYVVLSSWGPFLDRHGQVKPDLAAAFLARIAATESLDALLDAFPYRILAVSCDIAHFYAHYGVAPPPAVREGAAVETTR